MTDVITLPAGLLITARQWQIVHAILQQHVADYAVWAFGSRVGGPCKDFSDLDLVVISETPLPLALKAAINEAFSESELPWKVDVVDWATTDAAFQQRILAKKLVLQKP
ncbi:MAG: nucleotidyltransferase domain-containing protein [Rheinheimera sp.]|nr:nucleotidyltransferase domain-containing protein [Rheinheimera sp.]